MIFAADNRLTPELDADLAQLAEDDAPLDWWRQAVVTGEFQVIVVSIDGRRAASILWNFEAWGGKHCFAIRGAVGSHPEFDLMGTFLPKIEAYARRIGCARVIFHTRRRGLIARAPAHGFRPAEYVLVKDLVA